MSPLSLAPGSVASRPVEAGDLAPEEADLLVVEASLRRRDGYETDAEHPEVEPASPSGGGGPSPWSTRSFTAPHRPERQGLGASAEARARPVSAQGGAASTRLECVG